jgi:hypothetical protein
MNKSFTHAPKPKPPTDEAIAAFERGGIGQDQHPPVATNGQSHIPPNVGNKETTNEGSTEPIRRLSIDIPASLHRRFKTACSKNDKRMQTEVESFIVERTAELEKD